MAIVFEKRLGPTTGQPEVPDAAREASALGLAVVFTSVAATLAALKHASILARSLTGKITLLVPQIVPYPRPLTSPPALIDWSERRFRAIAAVSPVDTAVRIYLCRDRDETLLSVLPRRALVVIGGSARWWRLTAERRLARKLRNAGHEVILIETE
jgi:hypothetical protein